MRSNFIHRFCIALWWGSLTTIGFVVVPLLFVHLDTPQAAGRMAAVLFDYQDYLGWICGALLLAVKPHKTGLRLIFAALAASVLIHFAVAPHISAHEKLHLWHPIGTVLYVVQWVCLTAMMFITND